MQIHEKLIKPVIEAKYLTVDNTDRYRSIIRLFYMNYEKLKYWMYQEEIYEELHAEDYFAAYTMEQCQQDLAALVSWGNLLTIQDTRKVSTIEEFKNKKFRYQLSEYAVEIERMIVRLENLFIEGASLEPTLLERIRKNLSKMDGILQEDQAHIHGWWGDLNNDFVRLNQNYQDYMRELNSVKAEEMMKTKEFLVFKDRLIDYLRSFVKSLQLNVSMIEQILRQVRPEIITGLLEQVTSYELSVPRMDVEVDQQQIHENMEGRLSSIFEWFMGREGTESEAAKVFDTTNEIIRKITRYATRISEQSNSGANRREEYYKLAVMFSKCHDIHEAHCLSSSVFGIEKPLHLKENIQRKTESINSGVYEEEPCQIVVKPRTKTYREKADRSAIVDRTKEKEEMRQKTILRLEEERKLLDSYVQDDCLEFAKLPVIEPHVRNALLIWLSKAMENKKNCGKTEDGRIYYVEKPKDGEICYLNCTDGMLEMPSYTIIFKK